MACGKIYQRQQFVDLFGDLNVIAALEYYFSSHQIIDQEGKKLWGEGTK